MAQSLAPGPSHESAPKDKSTLEADLDAAISSNSATRIKKAFAEAQSYLKEELVSYALQTSCRFNKPDIVALILTQYSRNLPEKSKLPITSSEGKTLLMLALDSLKTSPTKEEKGVLTIIDLLSRYSMLHIDAIDYAGKIAIMYPQTLSTVETLIRMQQELLHQPVHDIVNAKDICGQTVLMWAMRENEDKHCLVAKHLIEKGADIRATDNERRSVLTTAVWMNRIAVLKTLIDRDRIIVKVKDKRDRNVLHHLLVDQERMKSPDQSDTKTILNILLDAGVDINGLDWLGRSCVFCALLSGNVEVAKILLERPEANFTVQSTSGWTLLHAACENPGDCVEAVQMLESKRLDVNEKTSRSGKTPLHLATQAGNFEIIKHLLQTSRADSTIRDAYGNTPLLCAMQHDDHKRAKIGDMFAPWTPSVRLHLDSDEMADVKKAAESWKATIFDFGDRPVLMRRESVYNVIHKENSADNDKPFFSTIAPREEASTLRWVHLPANNTTWCRDLIIKAFIERGSKDSQGFKDLERSLMHQHRGRKRFHHSRYMTPTCQTISSLTKSHLVAGSHHLRRTLSTMPVSDGDEKAPLHPSIRIGSESDSENFISARSRLDFENNDRSERGQTSGTLHGGRPGITISPPSFCGSDALTFDDNPSRHLFLFMPYLHFERYADDERIKEEIHQKLKHGETSLGRQLFHAFLHCSNPSVHIRRTLDQYFYHNIDTDIRDRDQVIHRYQKSHHAEDVANHKILMVDQLWMWIIDKDLVVTSFPQVWKEPASDPVDILENIIESFSSTNPGGIANAYELATFILGQCAGAHEGHGYNSSELKVLDIFESAVGEAMDQEVKLFKKFQDVAGPVSKQLQGDDNEDEHPGKVAKLLGPFRGDANSGPSTNANINGIKSRNADRRTVYDRNDPDVESLLKIRAETKLIKEVKDIRDELGMLKHLFLVQHHVIPQFHTLIREILEQESTWDQHKHNIEKLHKEQARMFDHPLKNIDIMDKQAQVIYESLRDTLDLKQKHVNNLEARASREQAVNTAEQGKVLMVFTIVTVIFSPLSFIASFFALNIDQFPRNDDMSLSLHWVAKWMFGLGIPIAITCVLAAILVGPTLRNLWALVRKPQENSNEKQSSTSTVKQLLVAPDMSNDCILFHPPLPSRDIGMDNYLEAGGQLGYKHWRDSNS